MKKFLTLAIIGLFMGVQQLHAAEVIELYHACKYGKIAQVKELIAHGKKLIPLYRASACYFAAKYNRLELVQYLIEQYGYEANGGTDEAYAPLIGAAINGSHKVAQFLIEAGADVNKPLLDGSTSLYFAAKYGNLGIVQHLIEMGAHVKIALKNGETALHAAAYNGHLEVLRLLVCHGADINALYQNKTPFQHALQQQKVQAAHYLIRARTTVTEQDLNDARHNECFVEIVSGVINFLQANPAELPKYQAVIQKEVDVRKSTLQEWLSTEKGKLCAAVSQLLFPGFITAPQEFFETGSQELKHISWLRRSLEEKKLAPNVMHRVLNQYLSIPDSKVIDLYTAIYVGDVETVKKLIHSTYIRHTFCDYYGITALHLAVQMNQYEVVRFLVEEQIDDVNCTLTHSSWNVVKNATPLYLAAELGHDEVVNILLKAGAQPDKPDNTGTTPLNIAYQAGHHSVIKLLLDHGASVDQPLTEKGRTLLHRATENSNLELIQLAIKAGADVNAAMSTGTTPLYRAAHDGNHEVVDILLKADAQPDKPGFKGLTPLNAAMIKGHKKVIKLLLDHGAHVNQPLTKDGATLLYLAAERGNLEVVQFAIQANADVNMLRHGGYAPLNVAAYCGHEKIVRFLMQAGADIHKTDNVSGATPLHVAAFFGHLAMVKTLIHAGASTDMSDAHGATPLYLALIQGHLDVASLLIQRGARVTTNDLEIANRSGFNLQKYSAVYRQELSALLSITQLNEEAINTILAHLAMPRFY